MYTRQEAFEVAVNGLLSQDGPSLVYTDIDKTTARCKYRGENGRKCAIGWLLPDKNYHESYDKDNGYIASVVIRENDRLFNEKDDFFYNDMQAILHDKFSLPYGGISVIPNETPWKDWLISQVKYFKGCYNLSIDFLNNNKDYLERIRV